MKVKISQLSKELGKPLEELVALAKAKLEYGEYKGGGKLMWLTPEAADKLRLAEAIPAVVPDLIDTVVLSAAPNPKWAYVAIEGKRQPALFPLRLRDKLIGKPVKVHAITDATGTTYRYAPLGG